MQRTTLFNGVNVFDSIEPSADLLCLGIFLAPLAPVLCMLFFVFFVMLLER
jgi:hypothetical protein